MRESRKVFEEFARKTLKAVAFVMLRVFVCMCAVVLFVCKFCSGLR